MKIFGGGGQNVEKSSGKNNGRRRREIFSDFVVKIGLKSPKSDLKVLNIIILKEKPAAGANFLDFL